MGCCSTDVGIRHGFRSGGRPSENRGNVLVSDHMVLILGREPGLVHDVLRETYVGGVDEGAIAADRTDAVQLGAPVDLDRRLRLRYVLGLGENTALATGTWRGWIAHLPSKPSRLACRALRR